MKTTHDDVTHPDEVHEDYFIGKNGSEMKHIPKDHEVKTYIQQEFSNQNFAIAGEKSDEYHAVPSVTKLTEKLTDEEVDEMILETDVDETSCPQQLADVSVQQFAERIVEVVTAFHGSESQNESLHRSSTCQDTHTVVEKIIKDSQSHAAICKHTARKDCLETRSSSELV